MKNRLMTNEEIETLRKEYSAFETIPMSRVSALQNIMDKTNDTVICQLADAKIKFVSGLARNRKFQRGL